MKRLYFLIFAFFIYLNTFAQVDTLHFLAVGDWGRQGKFLQKETANMMGKYADENPAEFIISTGDNFYEYGISSVYDTLIQLSFENIYTAKSLHIPWYITFGNHDYALEPKAQIELSKVNPRWKFPSSYYSIDEELKDGTRIQFLFLDTNPFVQKYYTYGEKYPELKKFAEQLSKEDWKQQLKWLESSLKNCDADWKIVVGHHTVLSGGNHGNTKELVEYLKPLFEKYGVQMYICGHDHDIQYLKDKGVNYFVSGAGSELRETGKIDETVFSASINAFLSVKVSGSTAELKFISYTGETLFETKVKR